MSSEKIPIYEEGQSTPDGFSVENTMNKDENTLPFGYFDPSMEGKLTWICSYGPPHKDKEPDIVSIFTMDLGDHVEKEPKFLRDIDEAKFMRDELIKAGWRKLIPPKIEFTVTREDGSKSSLNRRQKRALEKKIKKIGKNI